jgi:hypothetical protein
LKKKKKILPSSWKIMISQASSLLDPFISLKLFFSLGRTSPQALGK